MSDKPQPADDEIWQISNAIDLIAEETILENLGVTDANRKIIKRHIKQQIENLFDRQQQAIRTKYISREAVDGAIQRVAHRGLMLIQNYKDEHGIDSIAPVGALRVGTDQLRRELGLEGDK